VDAQTRKQHIPFFDEPACTCTGEMLQRSVTRLAAALVPEERLDLASHKINRHLSMLAAIAIIKKDLNKRKNLVLFLLK
jgi:hypothetical protein